jgi:hypothetical protein
LRTSLRKYALKTAFITPTRRPYWPAPLSPGPRQSFLL